MARVLIDLRVNEHRHEIVVPAGWTGSLTVTLNVHEGRVSRKIFVGRSQTAMLEREDGEDGEA